jgi:cell division protein FtsB
LVIASIALSTVWGGEGLVARDHLERELDSAVARLAAIDRENQRLLREIDLMDRDPQVLERIVAEELTWGRSDAVLYQFESEHDALSSADRARSPDE